MSRGVKLNHIGYKGGAPALQDVVAQAWVGVLAPANTPADVVVKTAAALNKATSGDALTDRLAGYGMRPLTRTPAQFGSMLRNDLENWCPVVKASGFASEE